MVVAFSSQGPQVADHHRVVIDVDHGGGAVVAADDLMHRRECRQPRAEVGVLADALGGHVVQGADQEPAVLPDHLPHTGVQGDQPFSQLPVRGEVILPAQQAVIGTGDIRLGGVEGRQRLACDAGRVCGDRASGASHLITSGTACVFATVSGWVAAVVSHAAAATAPAVKASAAGARRKGFLADGAGA